jgi:peptide/nickel transport system permease protein
MRHTVGTTRGTILVNKSSESLSSPNDERTPSGTSKGPLLANAASEPALNRRVSVWNRFRRHRLALIGTIVLAAMAILSVGAPVFVQHSPYTVDLSSLNQAPNSTYWLGTDETGRDVLSRLLHAGRVSLTVGITVVLIALAIGMSLGAIAGYFGGWVDTAVMRFVDVALAFPPVLLVITIVSMLGPNLFNLILVMGLLAWPPIARLLRAEFLSLRERDFILAARSIGVSGPSMVMRHLIPNAMAPIIVAATFGVATAILLEAGLSFLGLGVQKPTPSWGNMLSSAQSLTVLDNMPWLWVPPGLLIAFTVLAINFIGDGLRDALDPRSVTR